ncbi:MAG: TRAP transporter substrate-binding protein DctP [Bacillota bacterium]|jgi:TRAP-type C4-dicarboxylate transport system substrate-binding protein
MRKKGLLFVIAIVTVVMLTLTGCGSKQGDNSEGGDANAGGETKIVLKLADHLQPEHPYMKYGSVAFMERVKEESNGRIDFVHFPSEQAGAMKDQLNMVQTKIVDISSAPAAIFADQVPLSNVVNLPGWKADNIQLTKAYYDLATDPDSTICKNDFDKNNVKVLFTGAFPLYQIQTSKKPIKTMEDIKGLRLRSPGGSMDLIVQSLGAAPVSMPPVELYEAMQRGTIDGMYSPQESLLPQKLHEVSKYSTGNLDINGFIMLWVINKDVWNTIPADLQELMVRVGKEVSYEFAQQLTTVFNDARTELEASGMTFYDLPDEELEKMNKACAIAQTDWVSKMDKQGLPGTETFKAFEEALNKYR